MRRFVGKTRTEIRNEIFEIAKEETGIRNFKSVGVMRRFVETFAKYIANLYQFVLTPLHTQTDIDHATGAWLSQWGLLLGVARKTPTKAKGSVTINASGSGILPAGLWVTAEGTDRRYRVVEPTAFEPGDTPCQVEAEFAGSNYNIPPGAGNLHFIVFGIEEVLFGEDWLAEPGTDDEPDDLYRRRIKDRWLLQGVGNPPPSFVYYAESVSGVRQAKLIRTPNGIYGEAAVIVAAENGMPSQDLLDQVYAAIESHGLICNNLFVRAPRQMDIDVRVEFRGEPSEADVQEALLSHINRLGIGGRLEIRSLYTALEHFCLGSLEILLPVRDVQVDADSIIVPNVSVTKLHEEDADE